MSRLDNLGLRNPDGEYTKYLTKDCLDDCQWYENVENTDVCFWGAWIKRLYNRKKGLRKCEVKNRSRGIKRKKINFAIRTNGLDNAIVITIPRKGELIK